MSVDPTSIAPAQSLNSTRAQVAGAIKHASASTGASFEYMVAAAKIESDLQPSSSTSTSSARGLYQFIDQTWLGTVKEAGASFGYGRFADAITRQSSGSYTVSDPTTRQQILKLRDDPTASAAMAGVLTQSNSFKLVSALGRRPTDNELYMAHFLGVGGASRLIAANDSKPQSSAVQMFPRAAAANKSIFYDRSGNARSVGGVYAALTRRYQVAANSKAAQSTIALAGGTPQVGTQPQSTVAVASAAAPAAPSTVSGSSPVSPQAPVSRPVAVMQVADAGDRLQPTAGLSNDGPMFRSLFQVGDRPEPISPTVRELWASNAPSPPSSTVSLAPDIKLKPPSPLDLFSDPKGAFAS
jgi:hypothetical protein